MMKTKYHSKYSKAKHDIDDKLVADLKQIGFVSSITELSRACGKNPTYFACMRKRGYGLNIGSLAFLMARLSREMLDTNDVQKRAKLRIAVGAINEAIQEKCKLRELELLG